MTQDAERRRTFCISCGASLESEPQAVFCPYCGTRQSGDTGPTARPARSGTSLVLVAIGVALVLGGISFTITRLVIPDTAPPAAPQQQQAAAPPQAPPGPDPAMEARINSLRDSLIASPKDGAMTLRFANLLYDAGYFERATEFYERYLSRFDSTNADARVDYAHTLFNMERREEAIEQTKRALVFQPSHQVALFNMGIMTYQMQDVQSARAWFEKCIAAGPETELAVRARQALNSLPSSN